MTKKKPTQKRTELCPLTALQFLVLRLVHTGVKGADLRQQLLDKRLANTKAAFYQLITRLNKSGYLTKEKRKAEKIVTYVVTANGREAMFSTKRFYQKRSP